MWCTPLMESAARAGRGHAVGRTRPDVPVRDRGLVLSLTPSRAPAQPPGATHGHFAGHCVTWGSVVLVSLRRAHRSRLWSRTAPARAEDERQNRTRAGRGSEVAATRAPCVARARPPRDRTRPRPGSTAHQRRSPTIICRIDDRGSVDNLLSRGESPVGIFRLTGPVIGPGSRDRSMGSETPQRSRREFVDVRVGHEHTERPSRAANNTSDDTSSQTFFPPSPAILQKRSSLPVMERSLSTPSPAGSQDEVAQRVAGP